MSVLNKTADNDESEKNKTKTMEETKNILNNFQNNLDNYFEDENLEKIVDLPEADTFEKAIKKLKLPPIVCGKEYDCIIKLFTCNNQFEKKIQLENVVCHNNDFEIKINSKRNAIRIKGSSYKSTPLNFSITYKLSNLYSKCTCCSINKSIDIQQEELWVKNQEFQKKIQSRTLSYKKINVGDLYKDEFDISNYNDLGDVIHLLTCEVEPSNQGISATISSNNVISLSGQPVFAGKVFVVLKYNLSFIDGTIRTFTIKIPCIDIGEDLNLVKWDKFTKQIVKSELQRFVADDRINVEISLPESFDNTCMSIESIKSPDMQLKIEYNGEYQKVKCTGVVTNPGIVSAKFNVKLKTFSQGEIIKVLEVPVLHITPNPKTLWKNLPTDSQAPYQCPNEEYSLIKAGERTIVAASKRGRSHAHEGKFRDDNFKVSYIEETGWFIITVSDGAGSAKYSREGSRIACHTFVEFMSEKLSSKMTNDKIDQMSDEEKESALKKTILSATYECLIKIDTEAKEEGKKNKEITRKDYSATFLGYVMKHYKDFWLIVSIGIGDGIIGMIDQQDNLTLLTEPDGGEFVGQTRFITMNEVWNENPIIRTKFVKIQDFNMIMSMTDGVSDPKFETDNNLKNRQLWLDLRNEIKNQVDLTECSEETALRLNKWLDFWAKSHHDDRTIVLVY